MTSLPKTFLAVGAAHMDLRARASGTFRPAASNPGSVAVSVGGAMFNAASALRLLGARVVLVSARGGDAPGMAVAAAVEGAGIRDLSITWLDRRTASYTAILDGRGELVAGIADMEIYDVLSPRVLTRRHLREAAAAADALLLDANLPAAAVVHLLDVFGQRPVFAIGVSPAKALRLAPVLRGFAALFLSRAEATALVEASAATGIATLARLLSEAGARRAVITDGPGEAAILDEGCVRLQAPPPVATLRDVTGAGDTLAAVASLSRLRGGSFEQAVRLGMAAASRRIGAETGAPETDDLLAAIERIAADMPPARAVDADRRSVSAD